jgi:hypothetical protein
MKLVCLLLVTIAWLLRASAAPPSTPEEALEAFKKTWQESLARQPDGPFKRLEYFKSEVFDAGTVRVRLESSEECRKRVAATLTEKEKISLILFGSLEDLKPVRQVWVIAYLSGFANGFEALLDRKDGSLLFIWIVPEG